MQQQFYNKCLYVLTRDECFYVVGTNLLKYSAYLNELAQKNKTIGSYFCPIFLEKIISKTFQAILKYIEYLDNNCQKDNEIIINEINDILFTTSNRQTNTPKKIDNNYFTFAETITFLKLPIKHEILIKIADNICCSAKIRTCV